MPPQTQVVKQWREANPEKWKVSHKRQNRHYYQRHKDYLQKYYRERAIYCKEAKIFRCILLF